MLCLDPCVSRHRLKLNSRRSYLPKTFRNKGWRQIVLTKSLKVVFQFGLFSWHGCRLLVQLKIVQDPKAKNAKGEIKVYPFSFLNGVHPYKDPNGPGVQANHNKPNKTPHPTTRRPANSPAIFFSSLADVALRLGPYMSISCQKDVCTRTQLVHMSRQIGVE